jgi:hypothetical protein
MCRFDQKNPLVGLLRLPEKTAERATCLQPAMFYSDRATD